MPTKTHQSPQGITVDSEGNEFELRERSCPTCGSSAQRVLGYRGGKWHRYGLGVATRIVQCQACGLLFPNPFPYPRAPQQLYGDPSTYFQGHDEVGGHDERGRIAGFCRLIQDIRRATGQAVPSILDVGSGRGELLEAARREGLDDVVGLEFAHAMIEHVRGRYGISLVPQTIEHYAATNSRIFDAIVLNAVLEHVHDPDAMMAACAALTRPGGLVYINTPNEPNLLTILGNVFNRLRGNLAVLNLSPTWIPYHVYGFNPRALRVLLHKHGFEMTSLRIYAIPTIPSTSAFADRLQAFVATQICRVANLTGTAGNLYVWARRY
ncbi:MAG: class I SAM-dependent methyltransferase [Candidatus Omnitrophica bacterium]|nr:class I SAM-dependent methyltransferase [Candidatus Omnitrophota bacterium]